MGNVDIINNFVLADLDPLNCESADKYVKSVMTPVNVKKVNKIITTAEINPRAGENDINTRNKRHLSDNDNGYNNETVKKLRSDNHNMIDLFLSQTATQ